MAAATCGSSANANGLSLRLGCLLRLGTKCPVDDAMKLRRSECVDIGLVVDRVEEDELIEKH
jgi:hypothetical protein